MIIGVRNGRFENIIIESKDPLPTMFQLSRQGVEGMGAPGIFQNIDWHITVIVSLGKIFCELRETSKTFYGRSFKAQQKPIK